METVAGGSRAGPWHGTSTLHMEDHILDTPIKALGKARRNMNNYPPGVSGNEFEIAGPDYEGESDLPCPECGGLMMELRYKWDRWLACQKCKYTGDIDVPEPDPDRAYDEARDRMLDE